MQIVLASTSRYRKAILQKLNIDFVTAAPDIDESAHTQETPRTLVKRLSIEKAQAVAGQFPSSLIIGSDQLAVANGQILGKPGSLDKARLQLQLLSNTTVLFLTGLCLFNSLSGQYQADVIEYKVHFRKLSDPQIEHYLLTDKPFDSAGSFKSEGLGIALFETMEGSDPNTLIGLPLIRLITMLEQEGYAVL